METIKYLANKVYNELGPNFNESIYQNALYYLLMKNFDNVEKEYMLPITFQGQQVGFQRLDFLINKNIIIETKAIDKLRPKDVEQVKRYMRYTSETQGILINFGNHNFEAQIVK